MEKVRSSHLIEVLKENREQFDQQCRSAMALSPQLIGSDISSWVLNVIDPIAESVAVHDESLVLPVVETLWKEMLLLLRSDRKHGSFDRYRECWLMFRLNPALFSRIPKRFLSAVTTAMDTLLVHSETKADLWLKQMNRAVPIVQSYDELLAAGRLTAWSVGLAHLRTFATEKNSTVRPEIERILFPEISFKQASEKIWQEPISRAIGGFTGLSGTFSKPPLVTKVDGNVFASDGTNCYALFADHFGESLVPCSSAFQETLTFQKRTESPGVNELLAICMRYKDITSWEYHNRTLFITTSSSFSIFVFGGFGE